MPTRVDLDLYQLGIRLTQCQSLHRQCTNFSGGADDVGFLQYTLRSLREAFEAISISANLSEPQRLAGMALCAEAARIWDKWSNIPVHKLSEYDCDQDWDKFEVSLESLEALVLDAMAQHPQAATWLELGKRICDGARLSTFSPNPGDNWEGSLARRLSAKLEWQWTDLEAVEDLCKNLGLEMTVIVPELADPLPPRDQFPYVRSKHQTWQRVENGLKHLQKTTAFAPDAEQPSSHGNGEVGTSTLEDESWIPSYLGLEIHKGKRQVRRHGQVADLSDSQLHWSILRALVNSRDSLLSEDQLLHVWDRNGTSPNPAPGTITDAISKLRTK